MIVDFLLKEMLDQQASDIHLKAGAPPLWRINGKLVNFGDERLLPEDLETIAYSLMNENQKQKFNNELEIDLAKDFEDRRLRANISRQRGTVSIVLRIIPQTILGFDDLHLPSVLKEIALEIRGLILVTGTAGSGKSTTLAAMINYINENNMLNIITIEDPIEFIHQDKKSCISHKEVGVDTSSFASALKNALRQDPDLIMVGEMRDRDTLQGALNAAETGHAVMSSLHTIDASQTIERIIDTFQIEQQNQIRGQLASTLTAVISLRLLPTADGKGRVPAVEVLRATSTVRALIRENKISQIKNAIQMGTSQYDMQTFDLSLLQLYRDKLISMESALAEASSPSELKLAMDGIIAGGRGKVG